MARPNASFPVPVRKLSSLPDLLRLAAGNPERYPYLLETHGSAGWAIVFAFPQGSEIAQQNDSEPFLPRLDRLWREQRVAATDEFLPFHGGWFVYLGYELLHQIEPTVVPASYAGVFPLAVMTRIPAAVLVDKQAGEAWLFAEEAFSACLDLMQQDLSALNEPAEQELTFNALYEEPGETFLQGVERIKRYILEGDVFQVNLSREWRLASERPVDPAALYARLRRANPAPFAGLARFGDKAVVSSSPERLAEVRRGRIQTRPIAGTYARIGDAAEDARLREELLQHPKERAEHVMLVDLERNDLGRICLPGSVKVDELMQVASYAFVHHIESTVSGQLRPDVTPGEVLRALFPGGTITGCPKVRTMQIIAELERNSREAYTGSMGYLNHDGDMDLNILIRTLMVWDNTVRFKAGAGIVADSQPERELRETRAKARGLLRALGAAET